MYRTLYSYTIYIHSNYPMSASDGGWWPMMVCLLSPAVIGRHAIINWPAQNRWPWRHPIHPANIADGWDGWPQWQPGYFLANENSLGLSMTWLRESWLRLMIRGQMQPCSVAWVILQCKVRLDSWYELMHHVLCWHSIGWALIKSMTRAWQPSRWGINLQESTADYDRPMFQLL